LPNIDEALGPIGVVVALLGVIPWTDSYWLLIEKVHYSAVNWHVAKQTAVARLTIRLIPKLHCFYVARRSLVCFEYRRVRVCAVVASTIET